MGRNAIVGQSGGPTSVINSSLAGVLQACQMRGAEKVYGMVHGIEGLLQENVIDLGAKLGSSLEIELLKRTPSSYLGSCRFKLPKATDKPEVYEKLFAILKKLDIGYFFYIGGNDSMDTIMQLSDYAKQIGSDIRFMGVPKTIDNDLMLTDHTPGYGSAAKYVAMVMKEIVRDATVYGSKYVTIIEIMGRNAGWLTAAAALARGEDCEGVDLICLPELPFHVDRFLTKVETMQKERNSVVIAVSEGVKLPDGRYVCELADDVHAVDSFGHKSLTGTARFLAKLEKMQKERHSVVVAVSEGVKLPDGRYVCEQADDVRRVDSFGHKNLTGTARYLANLAAKNMDTKTRSIELSTLQRCAAHMTSRTDITEAYQVGGAAAKAAFEGHTGMMVALKRISNDPYQCTTELVDVHKVANFEKKVPLEWINDYRTDMKPEFLHYARPLIQAELTPVYIEGLPRHIYMR